jgi:PAS domain S-box-containing protein
MYTTRQYLLVGVAAGTLAMLVIAWLVMRHLTAPLVSVTRQVEAMGEKAGGLQHLSYRSADEIGTLVKAFNRMVTAQEQQQEALRESHTLLQNTFASLNEAVFIVETGTRKILDYNDAVKDMFGYARGELIGASTSCLHVSEEMSRRFGEALLKAYEDYGFFESTYRMKRKNGTIFDSEHFVTPIYDDGGRITSHVCVVRDISERKLAEEKLRRSEEKFRNLVETTGDLVWETDVHGAYTYTSPRLHDILGYEPDEVLGKTPFEFMPSEEARRVAGIYASLAACRQAITVFENTALHKNGRTVVLEKTGIPFFDGEGKLLGYRGIDRDITERKYTEEQIMRLAGDLQRRAAELATVNRELETFSYTLSHDLKAPLAGIYISVEALMAGYAGQLDETGRLFVDSIHKASRRIEELLEAMLLLAQMSRTELQCEKVDLSGLALEILLQLRMEHPERKVDWLVTPDLSATGDPRLLRSALENLLGNAWKYTQHTGEAHIEFGVSTEDGAKVYFVRDNGAGFSMEAAQRLFQPFQRLHRGEEFKGTGIGLATVQRIIHRHGGRIWGSGEVGKGATFCFTLDEAGVARA